MFKFHDSNYLNLANFPNIVATVDTVNGNIFNRVGDTAVPFATDVAVQGGDPYVMFNIIDKPEILNTEDYKAAIGDSIRGWRIKDMIGKDIDVTSDLVLDTYSTVAVGNTLVPCAATDTTHPMGYKKVADVSDYPVYFTVVDKSTFGTFTVDKNGGAVKGGLVLRVTANA